MDSPEKTEKGITRGTICCGKNPHATSAAFDLKPATTDPELFVKFEDELLDGHVTLEVIVFIGVSQEKAHAFSGKKVDGRFGFERGKPV